MLAFLAVVLCWGFFGGVIGTKIAPLGLSEGDRQGPENDEQTLQVGKEAAHAGQQPGHPFTNASAWHPSAVCAVQRICKPAAGVALGCGTHRLEPLEGRR